MHRFKKKQYTNPTLVRSIAHCSRARVFNKRYQRHFCGLLADVKRHSVTNYLSDEKEKRERERERKEKKRKKERKKGGKERREKDKSSGARSSAAFVSRRHRSAPLRGLSLSRNNVDVHVRAVRSSEARAHRRVSPLFLICASNHGAPRVPACRASMLYSQISILKSAEQWRLFSVFNGHCASRSRGKRRQRLNVFCPPPPSHIFALVFARALPPFERINARS